MTSPTPWAAAFALALVAAGWGWLRPAPIHVPPPVERFILEFDNHAQLTDAQGSPIAVSPDGSRIVYVGTDSQRVRWLFSRGSERVDPVVISGTRDAVQPFFSPDGQWIGFIQDGKLRKVSLAGGAVVTICELPTIVQGATWGGGEDGEIIVYSSGGQLHRVPATGGKPESFARRDSAEAGVSYRWPEFLPGGRTVLFTRVGPEGPEIASVDLETREMRQLGQPGMSPHFVSSGHLVFAQNDGTLFAAPFDAARVRFTGPPQPVAEQVRLGQASVSKLGVSRTGALAYLSGSTALREIVIVERDGRVLPLAVPPGRFRQPRFSPDGRRIAIGIDHDAIFSGDIWVYDIATQSLSRLTSDSVSIHPEWMSDGRHVAYIRRFGDGRRGISRIAADGSGVPDSLLLRPQGVWALQFTPGGHSVVFHEALSATNRDIWIAPVDSADKARALLRTPFDERGIALSPDGRWLAYVSNETGSDEVYVRKLAEGSARWPVSTGGGSEPRWARGGRELFYRSRDSLYVVDVTLGSEFHAGRRRALFGGAYLFSAGNHSVYYDVSRDGSRFVMVRSQAASRGSEELHIVLHWFDNLAVRSR
jgi:Tol biopolymer transport system component